MASGSRSSDVRKGLDLIGQATRARLSRSLHDTIGPALCGAGLQLGIVSRPDDPESRQALDAARQALAETVENVRALSYETHPELASRCGLEGGLRALAQSFGCGLECSGAPAVDTGQAEGICRVAASLLVAGGPGVSLGLEARGAVFRFPAGASPDPDVLAALKWLARKARLALKYSHRDTGTTIAVRPAKERKPR